MKKFFAWSWKSFGWSLERIAFCRGFGRVKRRLIKLCELSTTQWNSRAESDLVPFNCRLLKCKHKKRGDSEAIVCVSLTTGWNLKINLSAELNYEEPGKLFSAFVIRRRLDCNICGFVFAEAVECKHRKFIRWWITTWGDEEEENKKNIKSFKFKTNPSSWKWYRTVRRLMPSSRAPPKCLLSRGVMV